MKSLNTILLEKLKINKDTKIEEDTNYNIIKDICCLTGISVVEDFDNIRQIIPMNDEKVGCISDWVINKKVKKITILIYNEKTLANIHLPYDDIYVIDSDLYQDYIRELSRVPVFLYQGKSPKEFSIKTNKYSNDFIAIGKSYCFDAEQCFIIINEKN